MSACRSATAVVPGLTPQVRKARRDDLTAIRAIYNQGIADRIATLDLNPKDDSEIQRWFDDHAGRYAVIVAELDDLVVGWASLNRYSSRSAYDTVADLSVYVRRESRGRGIGAVLMREVEAAARANGFHKIVLFALAENDAGKRLYIVSGFREVGIFREQGVIDGRRVDVVAMEKVLRG